jgi:uncharacterized protein (DUF58 family)
MGKLAERYADAARSGVYRVADRGIPAKAASEANARLLEIGADGVPALAAQLRSLVAQDDRRPCVVLIDRDARHAALPELNDLARQCRENALPFFAVLVDPEGALDLPALYKERRLKAP